MLARRGRQRTIPLPHIDDRIGISHATRDLPSSASRSEILCRSAFCHAQDDQVVSLAVDGWRPGADLSEFALDIDS
jgi:hypothetical protein